MMCGYQMQNSEQTLRQGIEEHYRVNPVLLDSQKLEGELAQFFYRHDQIHVVFGCSISFLDEARADCWTMMGTDLGAFHYLKSATTIAPVLYQDIKGKMTPEGKRAIQLDFKKNVFRAVFVPLSIFLKTRKMKKKWRWANNEEYLDRSLKEIREEFGIRL